MLIKGSLYIEEINKIKVFAFDKTGAITEGRLEVTDIMGFGNLGASTLVGVVSIEALSEHSIAKAIVNEYRAEFLLNNKVRTIEEIAEEYDHIAMVRGSVNDSALARATVGIAMDSDVAVTMADIAFIQDDLSKVLYLVNLSKRY